MSKFGQNVGYIDELYARYLADPASVGETWRDFFADYRPANRPGPESAPPAKTPPARERRARETEADSAEPLRGISAKIAENMTESLSVPTATSTRVVAVKVLEENRRIINQHQQTVAGQKVSFTHLIAWAIVRAIAEHPAMNVRFTDRGGTPKRILCSELQLGLAIDLERKGQRVLLVPVLKNAGRHGFPAFVEAYNDLVRRARNNQLSVDDFQGATLTLTNPGMIGTTMSVPRLMRGQGAIIGVGSIGYPAEYNGMAPSVISELGLSKVMTMTSTYDHRVVQGAASGAFLSQIEGLLQGENGFYDRIFTELGVPHGPLTWSADRNPSLGSGGAERLDVVAKQAGVLQLIRAYRVRGHLWADLDPLQYDPEPHPELELAHYGLTIWDLDREFLAGTLGGSRGPLKLRRILDTLELTYCRHIGVEYMHIQDPDSRRWLEERLELLDGPAPFSQDAQIETLKNLNAAEAFESFIGTNYVGQKRFSLEGAETLIPMLKQLLEDAASEEVSEVVIGMAHRGRLNVLANVIGKSYGQIFREFEGQIDPDTTHGSGDVKYHLGASGCHESASGRKLRISVSSNPSHLEAVNPVVEGMVRAKQEQLHDRERERVIPVLIHGDAAFAGQGVVAETLNLSQLRGYRTGGTIHIVVNNQIGFTTRPIDLRSSYYSTDVGKIARAPILHVNGDRPEEAIRVMQLAFAYRQAFKRDVIVDLVCYRRWGHNEADDPSYTNPLLYSRIKRQRSVRKLYTEQLVRRGDIDLETAERALEDFRNRLQTVRDEVRAAQTGGFVETARGELESTEGQARPIPETAVSREDLEKILAGLDRTPPGFEVHPKLAKQLEARAGQFADGTIPWALGEALAFGSLVLEGTTVRLSGEDSGRGTFSQRHAVLYDQATSASHTPLAHLDEKQAPFAVFDSLLSEFAVLGFEYGYSAAGPGALVLWEAQFGDFANGAQVIIDQFLSSAEEKWNQKSNVVLLLPHGYEGQGPEHSSARMERFLQLAARGNIRVANPSTPAQYFHLLRAQARSEERKPLIVFTPKSLLRHKACTSTVADFAESRFAPVIDPPDDTASVDRLLLCSGKVFFDLEQYRTEQGRDDVAVARLELLYPFPGDQLRRLVRGRPGLRDIVWVQEEPRNMGAWSFVHDRLPELLARGQKLRYVGRPRSSSPATGSHRRHLAEQNALIQEAFAPLSRSEGKRRATAPASGN